MSDTTTDPAALSADIAAFAAAVRQHLDDLPREDIDDLTEGLEADLLDQAADGDERLTLADPASYADELRLSAGLPPRVSFTPPRGPSMRERVTARLRGDLSNVRSTRLGAWTVDLLLSIRPVWWVFRGWVAYLVLATLPTGSATPFPSNFFLFLLSVAVIVVSIQWGRGLWRPNKHLRALHVLMSIAVVIAAIPVTAWAAAQANREYPSTGTSEVSYSPYGLMLGDKQITNIFGYDATGEPVNELRLFDQDGDPLVAVPPGQTASEEYSLEGSSPWATVPFPTSAQGNGWNVYPLGQARILDDGSVSSSLRRAATPPFTLVQPLPGATKATPAPTPSPAPTTPVPSEATAGQ